MRVLVVEDEPEMRTMLRDGLREHGHTVAVACDGHDGLLLATEHDFDIVLLDVLLPGAHGHSVATALRSQPSTLRPRPFILMLTACDAEDQIIQGLECGADDYLTKPFSFLELLARMQATTRQRSLSRTIDIELDPYKQRVHRGGRPIALTPAEFRLLECLLQAGGQTVTRSVLIDHVWGRERAPRSGNVDTLVNALRKKVDLPFPVRLLQTVRGVGYRLCGEPEMLGGAGA